AFVEAGFHVVCDKPLVHTSAQAAELAAAVRARGTVFGVTYNYTGYPMVRQAREMVRRGELGEIRKVVVEYNQGWLATPLEAQGNAGMESGLRLRVSGTRGTIEWGQEEPNRLTHFPLDGPPRLLTRNAPWLHPAALRAGRIPPGHPEGFIEAFANVYLGVAAA